MWNSKVMFLFIQLNLVIQRKNEWRQYRCTNVLHSMLIVPKGTSAGFVFIFLSSFYLLEILHLMFYKH